MWQNLKLEIGKWKLEIRNSKTEIRNSKLEIPNDYRQRIAYQRTADN